MQTQYELTTHIAKTNPLEMGFDGKNRSSYRNILATFSTFFGYHGQNSKMTTWVSMEVIAEISCANKHTVIDTIHYLRDIGVINIKKDRYKGATFLHNHYTWLGFRQPAIMFSEWLALKKAKTPYVKPEPVATKTPPEPLQQALRPCEVKPSDSTFEEGMAATEPLVKPEMVSKGVGMISMEDFIDGNVDMSYSEFLKHYAKVGNNDKMLTDKAKELYREHILEEATGIPF